MSKLFFTKEENPAKFLAGFLRGVWRLYRVNSS